MTGVGRFLRKLFSSPDPAFDEAVERLRLVPTNLSPVSKSECIALIRSLMNRSTSSPEELTLLVAESFVLSERIGKSPNCIGMPHAVWHFLHDADIRHEDPGYRRLQIAGVGELLQQWEARNDV